MSDTKIAVVYYSKYGHTKRQAEAVLAGISSVPDVEATLLTAEEAIAKLDSLDSFDAIVFGSATYMGSVSSEMKKFMEASVGKWFTRAWQNKISGGFTTSSNFYGDKESTLNSLFTFAMQQGMIWVGVNDIASSNAHEGMKNIEGPTSKALNRVSASVGAMAASFELKPENAPGSGDLETARNYGQRIALLTRQFQHGR